MAVSEGDLAFVLDQLARLGELRSRRMFGGVGLYCDDTFFALIDDGILYLKVDDTTRARYTRRRLKPFAPGGMPSMSYYPVPASILEDADALVVWAREAVGVAARAAKAKPAARRCVPSRNPVTNIPGAAPGSQGAKSELIGHKRAMSNAARRDAPPGICQRISDSDASPVIRSPSPAWRPAPRAPSAAASSPCTVSAGTGSARRASLPW